MAGFVKNLLHGTKRPLSDIFWWRLDQGVDEHHFSCVKLELLATADQLNFFGLMAVEELRRRLQLWEEFFGTHLKTNTEGADSVLLDDERALFMGREGTSLGQALVCPMLHTLIFVAQRDHQGALERLPMGGCGSVVEAVAGAVTTHDMNLLSRCSASRQSLPL